MSKKITVKEMKYMKNFNSFNELNEAKSEKKTIDYSKKFAKKIEEVTAIIDQAKKDDVVGIEFGGTWESPYEFHKIWIDGNKLKVSYKKEYKEEKTDIVNLKNDSEMDYEEAKYMFNWVKKCIKKGYKDAAKEQKIEAAKEQKAENESNMEFKKGDKFIINLFDEEETVTLDTNYSPGLSGATFVTLNKSKGVPYNITLGKFKKSIVKKL